MVTIVDVAKSLVVCLARNNISRHERDVLAEPLNLFDDRVCHRRGAVILLRLAIEPQPHPQVHRIFNFVFRHQDGPLRRPIIDPFVKEGSSPTANAAC
jgi:hypothetical protein